MVVMTANSMAMRQRVATDVPLCYCWLAVTPGSAREAQ